MQPSNLLVIQLITQSEKSWKHISKYLDALRICSRVEFIWKDGNLCCTCKQLNISIKIQKSSGITTTDMKGINAIQENDKSMRQKVETKKNTNLINKTSASFSPQGKTNILQCAIGNTPIPQTHKQTKIQNPPTLHDSYCEINISGGFFQPLSFCFFSLFPIFPVTPLAQKWAHLLERHLLGRFCSLVFGGAFCQMIVLDCQPCYRTLQFIPRIATIGQGILKVTIGGKFLAFFFSTL